MEFQIQYNLGVKWTGGRGGKFPMIGFGAQNCVDWSLEMY